MRPALERALEVARQGEAATPTVAAPKELVRYLDFQKLTGPALAAVLRVLDRDDDFRRRVLASTTPEEIGAAGWLALSRPRGWEVLLQTVAEADADATGSDAADRRLRDLQRALEASERKRAQADEALVRLRDEREADPRRAGLGAQGPASGRGHADHRRASGRRAWSRSSTTGRLG